MTIIDPKSTEKFNNLLEFYIRYHPSDKKNYAMHDIDYQFKTEELKAYNKEFVDEINAYMTELKANGELLAHAIAQSISW